LLKAQKQNHKELVEVSPKGPGRIGPCEPVWSYEFDPSPSVWGVRAEFKSLHDDPRLKAFFFLRLLRSPYDPINVTKKWKDKNITGIFETLLGKTQDCMSV
jgi:hypothetical protein